MFAAPVAWQSSGSQNQKLLRTRRAGPSTRRGTTISRKRELKTVADPPAGLCHRTGLASPSQPQHQQSQHRIFGHRAKSVGDSEPIADQLAAGVPSFAPVRPRRPAAARWAMASAGRHTRDSCRPCCEMRPETDGLPSALPRADWSASLGRQPHRQKKRYWLASPGRGPRRPRGEI